ncbi:sensor histidine kinase [Paenibacillus humicola]|uniref:sensor histidine kinase n=1 Tax=Paenibacillus humicola TaxID=3110540 RepID=UPI00237AC0DA|nr:histidine kinase [Paenibacillus humicola]
MLGKVNHLKLKSQLLILIGLSISIIILLQTISLSWFGSINRRNYSEFLKDASNQLVTKAVSFTTDIDNIATITSYNHITNQFINTQRIDELLRFRNNMELMIESIMLSNRSISDILITDLDMINIGAYRSEDFWVLSEIKRRYLNGEIRMDQPTHYVLDDPEHGRVFYVCVTKSFSSLITGVPFFTVVIYNADSFISTISSLQSNYNSLFIIADTGGNIVASNRKHFEEKDKKLIRAALTAKKTASLSGGFSSSEHSLVYQRSIRDLNWRVIGIIPNVEIDKDLFALKQFAFLMGIVIVAVLTAFGFAIYRSLATPIIKMARFMNSIGQNYSSQRLVLNKANEISLLARALNKMLDNIDAMTGAVVASQEKLYKAELAKKRAQFSAFQSQVNPHFLYNTLDCIRGIALTRGVPEISEIATAMAKIFRYSIKENNDVKVGDEIGCIKEYIKIIQIRQRNRFVIRYEIEEKIMDGLIPKMILQPLVENAVFHGLEQKKGAGTLIIGGYTAGSSTIRFTIEDDGKGMSAEVLAEIRNSLAAGDPLEDEPGGTKKRGLGIVNIDRRIKLLYGRSYGLSISSMEQQGTKVIIELPYAGEHQNSSETPENRPS